MGREFGHDDLDHSSVELMVVIQDTNVWRTPSRISPSLLADHLYFYQCVSGEGYVLYPSRCAHAHVMIRNKGGCGQASMAKVGG